METIGTDGESNRSRHGMLDPSRRCDRQADKERAVIDEPTLDRIVDFHGHLCPGLAMGIQAAQIALREIGAHAKDEEVVAVVETDMCGVDAIQFLTGCTFGKGNLIHRDWGKNAFSFFRRSDGRAIRISLRPDARAARPRAPGPLRQGAGQHRLPQLPKGSVSKTSSQSGSFVTLDTPEPGGLTKPWLRGSLPVSRSLGRRRTGPPHPGT